MAPPNVVNKAEITCLRELDDYVEKRSECREIKERQREMRKRVSMQKTNLGG